MTVEWKNLGKGLFASCPQMVEAPLRVVNGVKDIVGLMKDDDAQASIVVTTVSGGTAVSTIIKRTRAVVSTIGGPKSHIVVVARDFGVPCVVGVSDIDITTLADGTIMRLEPDGMVKIGVTDQAATSTQKGDASTSEPLRRSSLTLAEFKVLRSISFAGAVASPEDLIGVDSETSDQVIESLAERGLIHRSEVIESSDLGERELDAWFESERDELGAQAVVELYTRFKPLDLQLKELATAWQDYEQRDDWDGKVRVVGELETLVGQLVKLIEDFAAGISRFGDYGKRLTAALAKVRSGDTRYIASLAVDSIHTTWFQMHEDLLRVLDKERDE